MNPNLKLIKKIGGGGWGMGVGGEGGGGARVGDFFYKESKWVGWGRWTDRRTGPNQFAPSTSSKLGA